VPRGAKERRERRRYPRRPVHVSALIHAHGLCRSVTIVDYTPLGLRLKGTFGIAAGDRITVELLTGDRLPLVVAWAMGSEVGAEFVGPTRSEHPAIVALEDAVQRYQRLHPASGCERRPHSARHVCALVSIFRRMPHAHPTCRPTPDVAPRPIVRARFDAYASCSNRRAGGGNE
jgi:hypothetical protein